jgi:hypothetical protein
MMTVLMLSPANSAPQMLPPATHSLFEVRAGVSHPLQHLYVQSEMCVQSQRGEGEGGGGRGREIATNYTTVQ